MKKTVYHVWTEDEQGNETAILFEGTKTAAYEFYNNHGGHKAGLHIGYNL